MGSGTSQEEYESYALGLYNIALQDTCVLPDVGIDESLVRFSGVNSNTELNAFSKELVNSVPGYIKTFGSALGALSSVPNAVGLGALVISMIMEIVMKSSQEETPDSYSLLRRVFGEEKASSVRDTMSEYLKRHRMFINNNQRILEEIQIVERQLSNHLTILRNSLLDDGQMSTRGFKIWVNGASFHLQMLIHQARLEIQAGKPASDFNYTIRAAITEYLKDLDKFLEKYETYKTSTTSLTLKSGCSSSKGFSPCSFNCKLKNTEANCEVTQHLRGPCENPELTKAYINLVFSRYEPIISLKNHFSNMRNNVDSLINQHDTFTLPSQ